MPKRGSSQRKTEDKNADQVTALIEKPKMFNSTIEVPENNRRPSNYTIIEDSKSAISIEKLDKGSDVRQDQEETKDEDEDIMFPAIEVDRTEISNFSKIERKYVRNQDDSNSFFDDDVGGRTRPN